MVIKRRLNGEIYSMVYIPIVNKLSTEMSLFEQILSGRPFGLGIYKLNDGQTC